MRDYAAVGAGTALPQMRLCHANTADSQWLWLVLERISRDFGTRVSRQPGGTLILPRPSQLPAS